MGPASRGGQTYGDQYQQFNRMNVQERGSQGTRWFPKTVWSSVAPETCRGRAGHDRGVSWGVGARVQSSFRFSVSSLCFQEKPGEGWRV